MTASGPPYKVKRVETVVKGSDVQARVFTLAPGEVITWHYHRETTDHYFVLEGILSISTRGPDVMARNLSAGTSDKIAPGTPHQFGLRLRHLPAMSRGPINQRH
jgi:quercetin dioxygenase-like cupin family protein